MLIKEIKREKGKSISNGGRIVKMQEADNMLNKNFTQVMMILAVMLVSSFSYGLFYEVPFMIFCGLACIWISIFNSFFLYVPEGFYVFKEKYTKVRIGIELITWSIICGLLINFGYLLTTVMVLVMMLNILVAVRKINN